MHIQTVIDNLERTIKGKRQLKEAASGDALINHVLEINIGELERILADVKKVRDFSDTPSVLNGIAEELDRGKNYYGSTPVTTYEAMAKKLRKIASELSMQITPIPIPTVITQEMIDAYLKANREYWEENDKLTPPITKWCNGTTQQATRYSLEAAFDITHTFPFPRESPRGFASGPATTDSPRMDES